MIPAAALAWPRSPEGARASANQQQAQVQNNSQALDQAAKTAAEAAITAANATNGADTITFHASVDIIDLATALPPLEDATGGITLDGGASKVVLNGNFQMEQV